MEDRKRAHERYNKVEKEREKRATYTSREKARTGERKKDPEIKKGGRGRERTRERKSRT